MTQFVTAMFSLLIKKIMTMPTAARPRGSTGEAEDDKKNITNLFGGDLGGDDVVSVGAEGTGRVRVALKNATRVPVIHLRIFYIWILY